MKGALRLPLLSGIAALAAPVLALAQAAPSFTVAPAEGPVTYEAARVTITAPLGAAVRSPAAGRVLRVATRPIAFVEIDHGGGYVARYAHLADLAVKAGDSVLAGQRIASVGHGGEISGPHIHVQLQKDGRPADPRLFAPSRRR